jgi:RHS repeat-associated protein
VYDGDTPVLEEGSSGQVVAANGMAADGWRARYYPGSVPGGAVAPSWGSQYYTYTYDPQGSLVQRQRQGNGFAGALDTASYDAYGKALGDTDSTSGTAEGYSDPVGFGGQYGYREDSESGLSLLGHRYYDPKAGRFLSRDPMGYGGGLNLYGYVGGNPVNYADPSGNAYEPIDWLLGLGAVTFDGWKLDHDRSAADRMVDETALALDLAGLLPLVPPGAGRAWALAHGGMEAVRALDAARTAAHVAGIAGRAAKPGQLIMNASGAGDGIETGPTNTDWPQPVIAKGRGVTIRHNYHDPLNGTQSDHGYAHAHVHGGGPETRIGPNGYPFGDDPPMTKVQRDVYMSNRSKTRRVLNKIGRLLSRQSTTPE